MKKENFSNDQLVQARILERVILRIRDNRESIESVFNSMNITYKPKTYYVLKKKYEKDGLLGLLPQTYKCGCKSSQLQNKIKEFIRGEKQKHPDIKGREIQKKILKKFKLDYTVSNINLIIKKLNIPADQGRPAEKKERELSYAGSFILQAAIMESRYIDQLISIQKEVMSLLKETPRTVNSKNSTPPGFNGIREEKGIFSKDSKGKFIQYENETTEDYKSNGCVSNKFQSVQKRVQTRDLSRLSIVGVTDSTLYRKNMTLLFLPVITSHGRAIEINETQDNELECFAGYDYKGNTLDKYLREMKFLQSSQIIINKMASFWYRLWEDKTGEHVTQVCYFFDGQSKPLWSEYSVKKSKVSKVGRVMGCLEQVYVHSDRGYPLMLQTFSGGVYLPDAIRKLHTQLDKILPDQVNRISVFDGGGNSVEFYETFKDNTYFICILDNNQYKQDLSDMTIIERQEKKDGALYIEAEKTLKNSKNKNLYKGRIVVYRKPSSEKYIAFVTNIPIVNLTAEFVVEMYYKRWPNQEEQFRNMNGGVHLSTNYGFGKTQVINLVIQKKKKELDRQINIKRENIKKITDKISLLETQKNQTKKHSIKQEYQTKIRQTEKKISELPGKKQVKTLLKELKQLYLTLEQTQTEMIKNELKTKAAIEKLHTQRKRQEHLYEKHMAEFTRIKDKELVYENDVELDQLLGSYKIAFANLCAYVLKEYFPGLTLSLEKLINKVFKRPGKLITKGRKKEVIIYLNNKDKKIDNFINKACSIINNRAIKLYDNTVLKLVPTYQ